MIWFLLIAGVLLVGLGVWGGPRLRQRPEKSSRIPKDATVQEAWDILTSPVQYDEELIKIPDHKPFRIPSGDRRFYQGLTVGLGAGLVFAAFLSPFMRGGVEQPAQIAAAQSKTSSTEAKKPAEPAGSQKPDGTAPATEKATPPATQGAAGQGAQGSTGQGAQGQTATAAKPATVTITVEPGSSSFDIAALLKGAGLIKDEQEFLQVVAASGVETNLQAGTFVIPTNATVDQVIAELTK